jgi:hypothetical protein
VQVLQRADWHFHRTLSTIVSGRLDQRRQITVRSPHGRGGSNRQGGCHRRGNDEPGAPVEPPFIQSGDGLLYRLR